MANSTMLYREEECLTQIGVTVFFMLPSADVIEVVDKIQQDRVSSHSLLRIGVNRQVLPAIYAAAALTTGLIFSAANP
ncbi:hypothetical protein [Mesorhizobium sp. LSJC268A00]|uniref:hypothetical protein n=2 Tax=Mesorhizobium TaxID=68287 RepID=UPI001AEC706B|nr:hypothetical protein [Mesorhizobium sp. LSJC268A00]